MVNGGPTCPGSFSMPSIKTSAGRELEWGYAEWTQVVNEDFSIPKRTSAS